MTTLLGLELAGCAVLVVGGGPVAARRALAMVAGGANVLVVAPDVCETLRDLHLAGEIDVALREAAESDLDGRWLVHTATGDGGTDRQVLAWARERRVFCVDAGSAGRPSAGTARTPATTTTGDLVLGVLSKGDADPRRSAETRDVLAAHLREGRLDLRRRRPPRPGSGRVVLVGGGPGDVGLMTVEGRRALAQADVVVTDRLGPLAVLDELPADVEVIDVGKVPGHHRFSQAQIGQLLVDHALRGRSVVRLKGGDPFLFGRGGEEVLACRAAGVEVSVLPGISSALSAPAAAGIPVTHRGTVGSVLVMNGQEGWSQAGLLAVRERSATVVVLMGVAALPGLAEQALAAGADPALPVAVIEDATLATQRTTRACLADVAQECQSRGVRAPAVVVIGDVAAPDLLQPGVAA